MIEQIRCKKLYTAQSFEAVWQLFRIVRALLMLEVTMSCTDTVARQNEELLLGFCGSFGRHK